MKRILKNLIPIAAALLLIACGDAGFDGQDTSSSQASPVFDGKGDSLDPDKVGEDTVEGGKVEIEAPTEKEEKAIAKCSKAWGLETPPEFEAVRKIKAQINVGSTGTVLEDNAVTDSPSLTLIYAAVTVGGDPVWELTNPNGWYCIVVAVNVKTNLTVKLDENGKLADSNIAINVGSDVDESISAVGINVGSNVTVERVNGEGK